MNAVRALQICGAGVSQPRIKGSVVEFSSVRGLNKISAYASALFTFSFFLRYPGPFLAFPPPFDQQSVVM
jgi:hypothetical protein